MKKFMTGLGCIVLATVGYILTRNEGISSNMSFKDNKLAAATIPDWNYNGQLPLDLTLDQAKRVITDTIIQHDTVTVTNVKRVKVPVPELVTDTIYVSVDTLRDVNVVGSVKNKDPGCDDIEEKGVMLIIDGKTVYSSETNVTDEPQEL